jgi:3-hydroxyacyl-CoA dehydrogenase/enoyl-CoA hydratase/3-hydroxybutyryl-CoA epimerase
LTELIQTRLEADGVLVATIDMPGRAMNVFSLDLMNALDALMDEVERNDAIHSVVLTSGKSTFLAGADLVMVKGFTELARTGSEDELFEICGRLGRQFVRLETSPKPWVAAVNGLAMGGGLELAMACRARLIANNPRTQISLPEVRWGLLPGAGGTQRMPRLMGFAPAMSLLLSGRSLNPEEATEGGLFQRLVAPDELLDQARKLARELQGQPFEPATKYRYWAQDNVPEFSAVAAKAVAAQHGVSAADFENYPAHSAIIDSVLLGARQPMAQATAVEMRQFLRLMFNSVAGNMVRTLFLNRQRADKELAPPPDVKIQSVRVGPLNEAAQDWAASLASCKLTQIADANLPVNTLAVEDGAGTVTLVTVCDLKADTAAAGRSQPLALLSSKSPYGRVIEIIGADDQASAKLARLALQLGAMPWRTKTGTSILAKLMTAGTSDHDPLAQQSLIAAKLAMQGDIADLEIMDVVACVANITPAYSGGPFNHLWQHQDPLASQLDAAMPQQWPVLAARLQETYA